MSIERILQDPMVSFWLKDALRGLQRRDPVDALHDVEALLDVARANLRAIERDARYFAAEHAR